MVREGKDFWGWDVASNQRRSDATTDKAVELTEKADSRPCPACGARATRSARFCPSCGVQMHDEASAT